MCERGETIDRDGYDWLEQARHIAARCWCDEGTRGLEMEPALAEAFALRLGRCLAALSNARKTIDVLIEENGW